MREQMLLRPHLLNKFDELPVNGNSVADWKKMEKALQIAMPIGLLSFILFGKGLLSKKLMWLWISIVTCGGVATTFAVYQSREASLAPASQLVAGHKPNGGGTASSFIAPAVKDTTIRIIKHKKAPKNVAAKKDLPTMDEWYAAAMKIKNLRLTGDTFAMSEKNLMSVKFYRDSLKSSVRNLKHIIALRDSLKRSSKNLKPVKLYNDSLKRSVKNLKRFIALRDSLTRSVKNLKPVITLMDTSARLRSTLRPARTVRDTSSVRMLRTLRPARTVRDTSLRPRNTLRPARTVRVTSMKLPKNSRPARTLRDTSARLLRNLRSAKAFKDTLRRP